MTADLLGIYKDLLEKFGPQDWWPARRNFRPKEWEICAGAILTQNTNWKNVERALDNLSRNKITSPESVAKIDRRRLEELVRPSGFYRQKALRLKALAGFVLSYGSFENFKRKTERSGLLSIHGIGPETCDSILLYACDRPYFVIDAYTRTLIEKLGIPAKRDYESIRNYFEEKLPKDIRLYKEFHALIVEWGKTEGNKSARRRQQIR